MKTPILYFIFILICFSANIYPQAPIQKCFEKPVTIFLDSKIPSTNQELATRLKSARKNIKEDEKLFIYVYSQGSWGTHGLETVSDSVRDFAGRFLLKESFFVIKGGYKNEASIDLFMLAKDCRETAEAVYTGNPEMALPQVDFADAPLGLSVFPKEMESLIAKEGNVDCGGEQTPDDCFGQVTFYVIVRRDGRVMYSTPLSVWAQKNRKSWLAQKTRFPAPYSNLLSRMEFRDI